MRGLFVCSTNSPRSFFVPLMILVFGLSFLTSPAWAYTINVEITTPNPNYISYNGTVNMVGSFTDNNVTSSPQIYVKIDNGGLNSASIIGPSTWSYQVNNLSNGWHSLTAVITDQLQSKNATIQVITITGHISQPKNNVILVQESNTCLILLRTHTPSHCPTLGDLAQYDTSNQKVAGKIIQKPDGSWARTKPVIPNWWSFVNQTGMPVVCVECNFDFNQIGQAQMIMLHPNSFSFPSLSPLSGENQTTQIWNGTQYLTRTYTIPVTVTTLNVNFDRYVSPDCTTADLVYSPTMMSDTIAYLDSNCVKTNLILNKTLSVPQTPFDFANSNWWHYTQWVKNVTQSTSSKNCQEGCNTQTDPFHSRDKKFGW